MPTCCGRHFIFPFLITYGVILLIKLKALLSPSAASAASTKLSPVRSVITYPLAKLNAALSIKDKSVASTVPVLIHITNCKLQI